VLVALLITAVNVEHVENRGFSVGGLELGRTVQGGGVGLGMVARGLR